MDEKTPLLPRAGLESSQPPNTPPYRPRRRHMKTKMSLVLAALGMLSALIILRAYLYPIPARIFNLSSSTTPTADSDSLIADSTIDTEKHHKHHHKSHLTQLAHLPTHLIPTPHNQRRLLIVGDVHGCPISFHHLLHKSNFNLLTDHLILAGDIINKGPSTHGAVKLARHLNASCVRGNHEDKCLGLHGLSTSNETSNKTLKAQVDVSACTRDLTPKDLDYLSSCPLILSLGALKALPHAKEVVVVHAGLVPGVKLEEQDPFAVMNMRAISRKHYKRRKDRGRGKFVPEEGRNDGTPWFKVWNREQEVLWRGMGGLSKGEVEGGKEVDKERRLDAGIEAEDGFEDGGDELGDEDDESSVETEEHGVQPTVVIYGHDSKTGLNIRKWSKGLDSGCVSGHRLSGLMIDADKAEVVSVKCKENK